MDKRGLAEFISEKLVGLIILIVFIALIVAGIYFLIKSIL